MLRLDKVAAWNLTAVLNSIGGLSGGIIIAWILFTVSEGFLSRGGQMVSSGALIAPNAAKCDHGSCWDGAIKWGYPTCTGGSGRVVMGHVIPYGASTCYKSIFFNLESNSIRVFFVVFAYFAIVARNAEVILVSHVNQLIKAGPILVAWLLSLITFYFSFRDLLSFVNEFYSTRVYNGALVFAGDALILSLMTHLASGGSIPVGSLLDASISTCLFEAAIAVLGPRQALTQVALRLASYALAGALLSKQSLNLKSEDSKSAEWGKRFASAGLVTALALFIL